MKLGIYSVFDQKAQAFFTPSYYHYKGEAVRSFEDIMKDPKSILNKHPEDYDLYMIGQFDDQQGKVEGLSQPELVIRGSEVKPV